MEVEIVNANHEVKVPVVSVRVNGNINVNVLLDPGFTNNYFCTYGIIETLKIQGASTSLSSRCLQTAFVLMV